MIPYSASGLLVLIVAYRADDHLSRCLAAIRGLEPVLVVDNDASESTRSIVSEAGVRYLPLPTNVGFAAAVNAGLDLAWDGSSDVLLLNPDSVIDRHGVNALRSALRDPAQRLAAVGPRLVDETGGEQRADWAMPSPTQMWLETFGADKWWRGRRFVVGAVLMLRGTALAEVGGFDERYFLYAEEADWQLRALRKGWSVKVVDGVTAVHVGGASSSNSEFREQLAHGSAEAFARRWYGTFGWWLMRLAAVLAAARRSLAWSPQKRAVGRRALVLYLRGPLKLSNANRRNLA
jgi:GT2 family glycosyltransferase